MTLLVYTATIADTMRPETAASIKAQETDVEYVWEVGRHNPFPGEKLRNVAAQYQRAWEMTLAGGYDALLTVEHDMTMPPDAIQKLYETDAKVVYGVYMLRHGTPTLSAWQYINNRSLGMSLSLYPNEVRKGRKQGWLEVCGVGWGCTLIRREVLERITVRSTGGGDAGDMAFATDCVRAGIRQIARFDVPCGHITPEGIVLHPDKDWGGILNRVLALTDLNANVGGSSLPMRKGSYYTVPPDVALDLQRAGYVKITTEDDSQQEVGQREQPDISAREMAVNPKAATRSTRAKRRSGESK